MDKKQLEELAGEVRLFVKKREYGVDKPYSLMDILHDFIKEKESLGIKINESDLKIAIMLSIGIDTKFP